MSGQKLEPNKFAALHQRKIQMKSKIWREKKEERDAEVDGKRISDRMFHTVEICIIINGTYSGFL